MSAASVLAQGRAAAEALMVDACTIKRRTSESTDPNSGVVTPTYSTLYTGKCRVQQRQDGGQGVDAGEAHFVLIRYEVSVPMSVTGVREGDELTVTASALDADLVNKVFLVQAPARKTHLTARRLAVLERTS